MSSHFSWLSSLGLCAWAMSKIKILFALKIILISSHVKKKKNEKPAFDSIFCTELILARHLKSWQVLLFQEHMLSAICPLDLLEVSKHRTIESMANRTFHTVPKR